MALSTALKKNFPVIAASISYLDDLIFYTENDGLVVRSEALMPVLHLLVSSIDSVTDMMGNDVRLGVREHCLSAIFSASEKVYPSVDAALYTQESSFSINAKKIDIATAYLLAFAPLDVLNRIDKAFAKYRRQELKDVIGADHQGYPRDAGSSSALYDLMMIYGIKRRFHVRTTEEGVRLGSDQGSRPEDRGGGLITMSEAAFDLQSVKYQGKVHKRCTLYVNDERREARVLATKNRIFFLNRQLSFLNQPVPLLSITYDASTTVDVQGRALTVNKDILMEASKQEESTKIADLMLQPKKEAEVKSRQSMLRAEEGIRGFLEGREEALSLSV